MKRRGGEKAARREAEEALGDRHGRTVRGPGASWSDHASLKQCKAVTAANASILPGWPASNSNLHPRPVVSSWAPCSGSSVWYDTSDGYTGNRVLLTMNSKSLMTRHRPQCDSQPVDRQGGNKQNPSARLLIAANSHHSQRSDYDVGGDSPTLYPTAAADIAIN